MTRPRPSWRTKGLTEDRGPPRAHLALQVPAEQGWWRNGRDVCRAGNAQCRARLPAPSRNRLGAATSPAAAGAPQPLSQALSFLRPSPGVCCRLGSHSAGLGTGLLEGPPPSCISNMRSPNEKSQHGITSRGSTSFSSHKS